MTRIQKGTGQFAGFIRVISEIRRSAGPGAATKNPAMEGLLVVQKVFADDPDFLDATDSTRALDALGKLVSEEFRRGRDPLGSREWAQFLALIVSRAAGRPVSDTGK